MKHDINPSALVELRDAPQAEPFRHWEAYVTDTGQASDIELGWLEPGVDFRVAPARVAADGLKQQVRRGYDDPTTRRAAVLSGSTRMRLGVLGRYVPNANPRDVPTHVLTATRPKPDNTPTQTLPRQSAPVQTGQSLPAPTAQRPRFYRGRRRARG